MIITLFYDTRGLILSLLTTNMTNRIIMSWLEKQVQI